MQYELPWNGVPFRNAPFLAFDTETAVLDPEGREYDLSREIPPMVLATVSDGTRHAVIRPEQMSDFVRCHSTTLLVGHNIAFDFWVVSRLLSGQSAWPKWDRMPHENLMDDTMLLDFLVRLADPTEGAMEGMRNLAKCARMVGMEADKESPYRMRFHELIGQDWTTVDRGFFDYAVQDTIVTHAVYARYLKPAAELLSRRAGVSREQEERHGLLTSKLQTRASIVLAQIGRNGMAIDRSKTEAVKQRLQEEIAVHVDYMAALDPPVFGYYVRNPRTGVRKVNTVTGVPRLNYTALRQHLEGIAAREGIDSQYIPKTPKGDHLTTKLDAWRKIAPTNPIVSAWTKLADTAKILQFVMQVDGIPSVHPRYNTVVRTGRTSCSKPNIQQMPKDRWLRELFVARPGYKYVIVDYSAIELRTLAAVLLRRYGKSRLAEVLKSGVCPHSYTASLVKGWSYEEVKAGVKAEKGLLEPGPYTRARQAAKAINFGVPGGLGARRLADYALLNYAVEMSQEEAKELRDKLVYEVYPELEQHLSYSIYDVLAANMHADPEEVRRSLSGPTITSWHVERVLRRGGLTDKGARLPTEVQAFVWDALGRLNQNPALQDAIDCWQDNTRGLCGETVATLTGRVRAGVDYGEARNTPFQGLAADGAKVALWNLHQAGYRIVGFIHDEIICEIDSYVDAEGAKTAIADSMKESMASVLDCDIPVEVEAVISEAWVK